MHDLAKTFLLYLNQETFETPASRTARGDTNDIKEYKMNYTR